MLGELDRDTYELLTTASMKSGNNWGTGVILYRPTTNEILVGERTDTHNFCTPGGKVEVGESPLQGVVRECYEESGLVLKTAQFLGYRAHTSPNGKNWVDYLFLSTDFEGEVKAQESEIVSWTWMKVEDALMLDMFPPTRMSLEIAIQKGAIDRYMCSGYGGGVVGVVEDNINGDGNGDTMKLPLFDQMPRLTEVYKNGRPDYDVCSYSCCDPGIGDSIFPYPYTMD